MELTEKRARDNDPLSTIRNLFLKEDRFASLLKVDNVKYGRGFGFSSEKEEEYNIDCTAILSARQDKGAKNMSISVAIIGKNGIVLATDSRVTSRTGNVGMSLYRDAGKKLWSKRILNKFNVGIAAVSDNSGFQEWLIDYYLNKNINPNINDFDDFVTNFSAGIKSFVEQYTKDMSDRFITREGYELGFTVIGYNSNNEPQIHYLQSSHAFSPDVKHDYYIAGIPSIGDYWMMKSWKHLFDDSSGEVKPKADVKTLKALAVMLISETEKLNNTVGGRINMVVLSSGETHSIGQKEINELRKHIITTMNEEILLESLLKKE